MVAPSERCFDLQVHLCYEDIKVDDKRNPTYLQVSIKASKTDPYRQGVKLYIGATNVELCPVTAVISFKVARDNSSGPLFRRQDGKYMTGDFFVSAIRGH